MAGEPSQPSTSDPTRPLEPDTIEADSGGPRPPTVTARPQRAPTRPSAPVVRGDRVDRYVIDSLLGKGGMGDVYTARDPELDRKIALKLIRPSGRSPHRDARMLAEAQALARLSHPNVVAVHDVGSFEGGVFIAMEYVDGITLGAWLDAAERSWREVVDVFTAVGRGLEAAHRAGLVHRDVKPDNIILGNDRRVRIIDFGVAYHGQRADSEGPQRASSPAIDEMVGTPAYMAPEQFDGSEVGPATDQFSFAVALYVALWRTKPFAGSTLTEISTTVRSGQLLPPPEAGPVPPRIRAAVGRALSTAPGDRFPSMRALVDAIQPPPRPRWPFAAAGVLAIGAAVAIGVVASSERERCAGFERELAGIWDAPRRSTLERAFAGAPSWATVSSTFDRYASDWTHAKVAACRARQAGGESAQLIDRRIACLDTRLRDLDVVVTTLAPGGPALDNAVEIAVTLPRLQQCENLSVVGTTAPPAGADRAQVREIEERLARLPTLRWSSRFDEGRTEADRAIAAAKAIGWGSAEARALVGRGWLEYHAGEYGRAKETHLAAAGRANASADPFAHASALIGLVGVEAAGLGAPDEAMRWAGLADAAVKQAGNDPELAGLLAHERGTALWKLERHAEAAASFRWSWAVLDRALGNKHPYVAMARFSLTNPLRGLGQLDEAKTELEQLLAMELEVFGDRYPSLGHTLNNLGLTYLELGRPADAEVMFRRALEAYERLRKDHPFTAWPLLNLANLAQRRGDFAAADGYWQRAHDMRVAALGESSSEVTALLLGRMIDRTNRGLDDEARTLAQRVLGRYEAQPSPQQGIAIGVACELERRQGSLAQAKTLCTKALGLLGDDPERYDVHATAAIVAAAAGERANAQRHLDEAGRALAQIKSERAIAAANVDRARAYVLRSSKPADAAAAAKRAIAVLAGDGRYRYYAGELEQTWK